MLRAIAESWSAAKRDWPYGVVALVMLGLMIWCAAVGP